MSEGKNTTQIELAKLLNSWSKEDESLQEVLREERNNALRRSGFRIIKGHSEETELGEES